MSRCFGECERGGLITYIGRLLHELEETRGIDEEKQARIAELEAEIAPLEGRKVIDLLKYVGNLERKVVNLTDENKALREVYRCAKGLCAGEDWNGGTAALYYRKPLREAVEKAKALLQEPK